jgi:hypothetical protein
MPWIDKVPSVLYQLFGGQAAGEAIAKALIGNTDIAAAGGVVGSNPGGKLSVSFPSAEGATWLGGAGSADHAAAPTTIEAEAATAAATTTTTATTAAAVGAFPPGPGGNCPVSMKGVDPRLYPGTVRTHTWAEVDYAEDVLIGYRWYEKQNQNHHRHRQQHQQHQQHQQLDSPIFCFGHGLSYSTFSYTALQVTSTQDSSGSFGSATVQVNVTNTGSVDGSEVGTVYYTSRIILHLGSNVIINVIVPIGEQEGVIAIPTIILYKSHL